MEVDRTMPKEEYEASVSAFRANMREALAAKRKYVVGSEAEGIEENQPEGSAEDSVQ